MLRFEVIPPGGIGAIDEPSDHDIATGGDLGLQLWSNNMWAMPWRTTVNAALHGAAPGEHAEAHWEARQQQAAAEQELS